MTTEMTATPADLLPQLATLPTDELLAQLDLSIANTGAELVRMAAIIRTLEERGVDLTDVRIGMLSFLRKIAYGQVAPNLVLRFAEYPGLLRRASGLPMPEQERLARGEPVQLAIITEAGGVDHRLVSPLSLTGDQLQQIFARDHMRLISEQASLLVTAKPKRREKTRGRCRADKTRQGLVVGRYFVPLGDVLGALADLRGEPSTDSDEDTQMVPIRLTQSEHRRLKIVAAESDCTLTDILRRALHASGLVAERKA